MTQSSKQPQLAANAPKHIFGQLERQKRISCREMWQRFLRKIVVTAKNTLKRSFEGNQIKIKVTR